jgi:hypothetical protein
MKKLFAVSAAFRAVAKHKVEVAYVVARFTTMRPFRETVDPATMFALISRFQHKYLQKPKKTCSSRRTPNTAPQVVDSSS